MGIDRLTMFLSNKWNIKEVLLFPAMKPTPEQADRMNLLKKSHGVPSAATQGTAATAASTSSAFSGNAVTVNAAAFEGVNVNSAAGLASVADKLQGKVFVNGSTPSRDDAALYDALSHVPSAALKTNPTVFAYYGTIGQFASGIRQSWH